MHFRAHEQDPADTEKPVEKNTIDCREEALTQAAEVLKSLSNWNKPRPC